MLFSHLRQRYAVYPLGAEHVDVVEFGQLLRRERFRRSEHHMPGIVHENIEPALFGDNLADRRFDGLFRRHVQFNGTQVNLIVVRKPFHVRGLRARCDRQYPASRRRQCGRPSRGHWRTDGQSHSKLQ